MEAGNGVSVAIGDALSLRSGNVRREPVMDVDFSLLCAIGSGSMG